MSNSRYSNLNRTIGMVVLSVSLIGCSDDGQPSVDATSQTGDATTPMVDVAQPTDDNSHALVDLQSVSTMSESELDALLGPPVDAGSPRKYQLDGASLEVSYNGGQIGSLTLIIESTPSTPQEALLIVGIDASTLKETDRSAPRAKRFQCDFASELIVANVEGGWKLIMAKF